MAQMKIEDIRALSPDQQDDAVLNLKKERFNFEIGFDSSIHTTSPGLNSLPSSCAW